MRKLKKIIYFLLVCNLITNFQGVFAQEINNDENDVISDFEITKDEDYNQNAIDVLTALGVMDEAIISGDEFMSRGEFAHYATALMGSLKPSVSSDESGFEDVPNTHTFFKDIMAAKKLNLLTNTSKFRPDDPIAYNEAITIMVRLSGYESKAREMTGVYDAYLQIAKQIASFQDVKRLQGNLINRVGAINLLYDFLEVDILQLKTVNSNYSTYYTVKGETVLSQYLGYKTAEGIVSKNPYTTLVVPTSNIPIGNIVIDGVDYETTNEKYYDLIGLYSKIYYSEKDDVRKIVYAHEYRTEKLEISAENIGSLNGTKLLYEVDGKTVRVNLSEKYNVIYNHKAFPEFTDADIKIEQGKVTLVKNHKSDGYDLIIIEEYKDYVVSSVNSHEFEIYTEYPKMQTIDVSTSGKKYVFAFDESDKSIKPETIAADSVISIFASKDGQYMRIFTSEKKAEGDLVEISIEDRSVELNYIPKKISFAFLEDLKKLEGGFSGIFYVNYFGEICGVDKMISTRVQYGYLINMAIKNGASGIVECKILNSDGKIENYSFRSFIVLDGIKKFKATDLLNYDQFLTYYQGKAYIAQQMIKFSLNANNEINYVDTLKVGANEDPDESLSRLSVGSGEGVVYRSVSKMFEHVAMLSSTANVFTVPVVKSGSPADLQQIPDDDYLVGAPAFMNNEPYTVEAYDVSDGGVTDVIVYKTMYDLSGAIGGDSTGVSVDAGCAVVQYIGQTLVDNEVKPKLFLLEKGTSTGYIVNKENTICKLIYASNGSETGKYKSLVAGDIIRYKKNFKGEIDGIVVDFDSERTDSAIYTRDNGEDVGKAYGMVYSQGEGAVRISGVTTDNGSSFDFSQQNLQVFAVSRAPLVIIDYKNRLSNGMPNIRLASVGEILDYKNNGGEASMIFIHSKWYDILESFIIKR